MLDPAALSEIRPFVATPSHGGTLASLYVRSLLGLVNLAWTQGFAMQTRFLDGDSLVTRARNRLVAEFMADPRYSTDMRADEVNDLIVDSMAACSRPVRAMIDAHDRLFGAGSGEAFLLGPYLDVLPSAVVHQVKVKTPAR